ncbi:IQCC protein, partial [Amia calva]|nr:IQCC protein [Amia calva]
MEGRELERRVTAFQAHVRGFLVRRRFSSLRCDYEDIVRELDGSVSHLQWSGHVIPMPCFIQRRQAKSKDSDCPAAEGQPSGGPISQGLVGEQRPTYEVLQPERDASSCRGSPAMTVEQQEPLHRPDAFTPVREGCEDVLPSRDPRTSPVQTGNRTETADWEGGRESGSVTDVTSVWDSTAPDSGSAVLQTESLHRMPSQEMPRTREGLRLCRNNLAMELLWLQQAIASRKKYLALKQRLGSPGR